MMKNVIDVLAERGLVSQMTESDLQSVVARGPLCVYCGFDATAPSLHVGNLVPVMALAHFQRLGHRPIIVLGGGTALVGDPGGKSAERPLLSEEEVRGYVARFRVQLSGYLSFEGENSAIMLDNTDWLGRLTLLEYLRDFGKHFTVNSMIAKDFVRSRLENSDQGISYTEFSYTIVQAIDYLHLYEEFNATVQLGGHDQWGNLISGVELIRRKHEARVHALTTPLITSASGAKFGKSEGNALYLDPEMTTPYTLYQYWINTDDRDVGHYLKIFTFLSLEEIGEIEKQHAEHPPQRVGQKRLAFELTKLIHGESTARAVAAASNVLFGDGTQELTPEVLPHLAGAVPATTIPASALAGGMPILDALVTSGARESKGSARRLIEQGGLYVNDRRWTDPDAALTTADALFGQAILLRTGKKYHLLLVA
ncbi:MAG: tyrosine--tRNA ligase [Ktedonobacterales bacterium]